MRPSSVARGHSPTLVSSGCYTAIGVLSEAFVEQDNLQVKAEELLQRAASVYPDGFKRIDKAMRSDCQR